jgi:Mn2+/Fe2+ NRAMP family transporter
MTVVFLAYVATAFMTTSDWAPVLKATVVPRFSLESGYIFLLITLIGTTITSYMQFFLQSAVVERGVTEKELGLTRLDVVISAVFADLIAFFIIVTNAQTLYPNGISIDTAADAARALEPLAGPYARGLFAIGLIGASLLAASVLPLSSAFVVTEAFGWERGISRSFREAPIFLGLYTGTLGLGALLVLVPNVPLVGLMLASQFIDGVQLPVILVFIVLLAGNRRLLGKYASGRFARGIQWVTAAVLGVLSVVLLVVSTAAGGS